MSHMVSALLLWTAVTAGPADSAVAHELGSVELSPFIPQLALSVTALQPLHVEVDLGHDVRIDGRFAQTPELALAGRLGLTVADAFGGNLSLRWVFSAGVRYIHHPNGGSLGLGYTAAGKVTGTLWLFPFLGVSLNGLVGASVFPDLLRYRDLTPTLDLGLSVGLTIAAGGGQ